MDIMRRRIVSVFPIVIRRVKRENVWRRENANVMSDLVERIVQVHVHLELGVSDARKNAIVRTERTVIQKPATASVHQDSVVRNAKNSVRMINGDQIVSNRVHVKTAENVIVRENAFVPMDGAESSVWHDAKRENSARIANSNATAKTGRRATTRMADACASPDSMELCVRKSVLRDSMEQDAHRNVNV